MEEILDGKYSKEDNVFKNAPHPMSTVLVDSWDRPYSREKAIYPVTGLRRSKFWPTVGRLDDGECDRKQWHPVSCVAAGDLNLICECGTTEDYA